MDSHGARMAENPLSSLLLSVFFCPIMPHYRRHLERPVLVETVTIRRLQGQTSRPSFVMLSTEQTLTSPCDNGVAQQLRTRIKTLPTKWRPLECTPSNTLSGCTWCFNDSLVRLVATSQDEEGFCWVNVGVCYNAVHTVQSERSRKSRALMLST